MAIHRYTTLGRSGLRVSPLCLGAMTFGITRGHSADAPFGWGADEATSRDIFNCFIDSGGNFVDTANGYTAGQSEEFLGKFIAERKLRDHMVIGTKFSVNTDPNNPNGGGNGRKSILRSLDISLRRMKTDYIDLYWMHFWDTTTPAEEVVDTLNALVRMGKILHYGFSNVPAWYMTRAHTLAEKDGKERPIALQMEYSLVARDIEREHVPATQELGMGLCAWSPLASGFLSGKYKSLENATDTDGKKSRLNVMKGSPLFERDYDRNWRILTALQDVSKQMGVPMAQVALKWLMHKPGVDSIIIGATRMAQFQQNLQAASVNIPDELRSKLDEASAITPQSPQEFFMPPRKTMFQGNVEIDGWHPSKLY